MKLKLLLVFIGVLVILLMAGLEIVQGEDVGYPAPIIGYPVFNSCDPNNIEYADICNPQIFAYPVLYPEPEPINNPVIPDSSIEPSSNPLQLEPIEPQYRNGRNLWQEIVYQFSRLLELMK